MDFLLDGQHLAARQLAEKHPPRDPQNENHVEQAEPRTATIAIASSTNGKTIEKYGGRART